MNYNVTTEKFCKSIGMINDDNHVKINYFMNEL